MKLLIVIFLCVPLSLEADLLKDIDQYRSNGSQSLNADFALKKIGERNYMIADLGEEYGVTGLYFSCKPEINRTSTKSIDLSYGFITKKLFSWDIKYNSKGVTGTRDKLFLKDIYGESHVNYHPQREGYELSGFKILTSKSFFEKLPSTYDFKLSGNLKLQSPPGQRLNEKKINYEISIGNAKGSVEHLKEQCASEGLAIAKDKQRKIKIEEDVVNKKLAAKKSEQNKYDKLIAHEEQVALKQTELKESQAKLDRKRKKLERLKNYNNRQTQPAPYVDKNVIACETTDLLDSQIASIISGSKGLYRGCFATRNKEDVKVLDYDPYTMSKIRVLSSGRDYWVLSNQINTEH